MIKKIWPMLMKWPLLMLLAVVILWPETAAARRIVTKAEVAAAIRNSPNANAWLKQNAEAVANLAINVESGGRLDIYNGSCCYGVLQMNTRNILEFAKMTPSQFRNADLQTQVNAWSALTSAALNDARPRQLASMSTFDGRPVTGELVLACVQLGIGNCGKMLRSGKCSGFADRLGTTICKMADKMGNTTNIPGSGSGSGSTGCAAADPAEFLSDSDGYGALDEASLSEYALMSPLQMIMTEADRRLSSDKWQKKLTTVSSRALWVDYTKVLAVENYLRRLNYEKRERIEAQLANLVSIRLERQKIMADQKENESKINQISNTIR